MILDDLDSFNLIILVFKIREEFLYRDRGDGVSYRFLVKEWNLMFLGWLKCKVVFLE